MINSKRLLNTLKVSATAVGLGFSHMIFAQTTTPGTPTTGFGGDQMTNILLILFALATIGVGALLVRGDRKSQ